MKRAIGWILVILVVIVFMRVGTVLNIKSGAINDYQDLGTVQSNFTQVKIDSANNTLTKSTASIKALAILKDTYRGHHYIQKADYSSQSLAWYVTAGDMNFSQFWRIFAGAAPKGPTYYVVLPDGEAYAQVLGIQ